MNGASFTFRYAVRTDRGPVRTGNQDAAFADAGVLALADGMGGHPAGDVAASLVLRPFIDITLMPKGDVVDPLRAAAVRGEDAIASHVAEHPEHEGMGTTLTAVMLAGDRLGLLHIGDSRAYLFRNGALYQLSRDHTFVQSLVDGGALSRDEARFHPQRNLVLRAVMAGRNDVFSLANFEVKESDRLLLCSDGISDALAHDTLAEVLAAPFLERCAEQLVSLALQSGTTDNATCIVADVVSTRSDTEAVLAGALSEIQPT